MGFVALQGGGEFKGLMRDSDLRAIELAGGFDADVCIIPAAAAPDRNQERAGQNGRQWFNSIGAVNVTSVGLIDRCSAQDPQIAARLLRANLIYLLGGFAGYLAGALAGTAGWRAIVDAYNKGAVVTGSSAGAMVLGQFLYDPERGQAVEGLGLLDNVCVLPHHNSYGRQWTVRIQKQLPKAILLGIDEETGAINDNGPYGWTVYGGGQVTVYSIDGIRSYKHGTRFDLPVAGYRYHAIGRVPQNSVGSILAMAENIQSSISTKAGNKLA